MANSLVQTDRDYYDHGDLISLRDIRAIELSEEMARLGYGVESDSEEEREKSLKESEIIARGIAEQEAYVQAQLDATKEHDQRNFKKKGKDGPGGGGGTVAGKDKRSHLIYGGRARLGLVRISPDFQEVFDSAFARISNEHPYLHNEDGENLCRMAFKVRFSLDVRHKLWVSPNTIYAYFKEEVDSKRLENRGSASYWGTQATSARQGKIAIDPKYKNQSKVTHKEKGIVTDRKIQPPKKVRVRSQLNGANGEVTGTDDHEQCSKKRCDKIHYHRKRKPPQPGGHQRISKKAKDMCKPCGLEELVLCDYEIPLTCTTNFPNLQHYHLSQHDAKKHDDLIAQSLEEGEEEELGNEDGLDEFKNMLEEGRKGNKAIPLKAEPPLSNKDKRKNSKGKTIERSKKAKMPEESKTFPIPPPPGLVRMTNSIELEEEEKEDDDFDAQSVYNNTFNGSSVYSSVNTSIFECDSVSFHRPEKSENSLSDHESTNSSKQNPIISEGGGGGGSTSSSSSSGSSTTSDDESRSVISTITGPTSFDSDDDDDDVVEKKTIPKDEHTGSLTCIIPGEKKYPTTIWLRGFGTDEKEPIYGLYNHFVELCHHLYSSAFFVKTPIMKIDEFRGRIMPPVIKTTKMSRKMPRNTFVAWFLKPYVTEKNVIDDLNRSMYDRYMEVEVFTDLLDHILKQHAEESVARIADDNFEFVKHRTAQFLTTARKKNELYMTGEHLLITIYTTIAACNILSVKQQLLLNGGGHDVNLGSVRSSMTRAIFHGLVSGIPLTKGINFRL